jgi:FlgD Ig-like domain
MRRVYYLSLLVCLSVIAFASIGRAQSSDRRGSPSSLASGYFIVDSDDNAPAPWRPTYFFLDTNYLPSQWNRVYLGPQENAPKGQYWFDPTHPTTPSLMDTVNDCMVGPIWMGMNHHWNFYGGNYDSVYFSSNGFIGFMGYTYATSGSPPNYCRPNHVNLATQYNTAPEAIVAALWTDLDLRHGGPADTSKVYYYTSVTADTFIVNYYNFRLRPSPTYNVLPNGLAWTSQGANKLFCNKFQIVLSNSDSSIQINYGGFSGGFNSFPPVLAYAVFGDNASIGLANENGTQGTGVLYGPNGGAGVGGGGWQAINNTCKTCNQGWTQDKQWAIKFKRWKDIVTAVKIDFPTRNYEICLGGSVTPQAAFENVDPVNAHTFKCRFAIRNAITGIAVYSHVVSLVNVLPGATRDTTFAPYTTNPNIISELGTFNACAIATSFDTADVNIGDQWPFDDTICTSVFGVRRTAVPFFDPSDGYSKTVTADIPDQTLWVSVGATVLDGESYTWDPPPPRYPNGIGQDDFISPVIQLDDEDVNGLPYTAGPTNGDTLTSFPINLAGKATANLTFDFQRAGKFGTGSYFTFPWDAGSMYGPEWTILNANTGGVLRAGDSLLLEFKDPAQPGCNPAASSWHEIAAIDGGFDFEFKKFFMNLKTGVVNIDGLALQHANLANYFTADFRFRFRLKSKYDGPALPPPTDDNDLWFVDNPNVLVPLKPEIEVMWVRVVNPYTKIPASEAISLPVYVKIANLSVNVEIAFPIRVQILDPNNNTVYWQAVVVNSLNAGTDTIIKMPNWNAQDASQGGSAIYTVDAWLDQPNFSTPSNILGTYTLFALNVDVNTDGGVQEFAYDNGGLDPGHGSPNDWPGLTGITGEGVGFAGTGSGSFAMKFTVATQDTFYGIRAYFGSANQSPDFIRLTLLSGETGQCVPQDTVQQEGVQSTVVAQRGPDWDQFSTYYFPKPIVLAANGAEHGVFWAGVSQLLPVSMSLGADLSRGGGIVRQWDPSLISPDIEIANDDPYGTEFVNGGAKFNNGDVSCVWAIEATPLSGAWAEWAPQQGWWPTMADVGIPWSEILEWQMPGAYQINGVGAYWAGSYTPSIRAMVSQQGMLPVQLLYLKGDTQNGVALLTWATATETNNSGFMVQRKLANTEDIYENLHFVASTETNSSSETGYGYIDNNVKPGTYSYRLLQTDVNGAQHLSNEIQLQIDAPNDFTLNQNYPNPFTPGMGMTQFSYTLTVDAPTMLVIYNQLGEVVKTLVNGPVDQGPHTVLWDGKDERGTIVASGSYICKLISGEYSSSIKVSVSK